MEYVYRTLLVVAVLTLPWSVPWLDGQLAKLFRVEKIEWGLLFAVVLSVACLILVLVMAVWFIIFGIKGI